MGSLDRSSLPVLLVCFGVLIADTSLAATQSGVQYSRDGQRVYVSKDVGSERWSITRERSTGLVSGLIFIPGGGEPLFVECDQRSDDGSNVSLACFGANACPTDQCSSDSWSFVSDVTVPASFFASGVGPPPEPEGCQPYQACLTDPQQQVCIDQAREFSPFDVGAFSSISLLSSGQSSVQFGSPGIVGVSLYLFNEPGSVQNQPDGTVILEDLDGSQTSRITCPNGSLLPVTRIRVVVAPECNGFFVGSFEASGSDCRLTGQFRLSSSLSF